MLFNSLEFLIFLPIVLIVYYIIPNKIKHLWLLVASYYFYMCWNAKYALLILTSTVITYISGLLIERLETNKARKLVVAGSFFANIGILFYFKYMNFFTGILGKASSSLSIDIKLPVFDIILPVGISFYTFQALGYTMDVYRNETAAEKNFFRYALFVSFFPQLVAGPIERSKKLIKQLSTPCRFDYDNFREGILLILWGFFLKIVLADRISVFVDTVYGDYQSHPGWYLIIATILFAFQVYCDFFGYSTIAMGSAQMLGIQLTDNFHAPYFSESVSMFWRNWHISLTSWFKDYLYIPLGGSRKGTFRKQLNRLIVFLVSGLWHGASFSFIIWGGLNGLYQVIGDLLSPLRSGISRLLNLNIQSLGSKMFRTLFTFILIDITWIFFRANRTKEAADIIVSILKTDNPGILFDGSLYMCGLDQRNFWLMIICIIILLFSDHLKTKGILIRKIIMNQDYWFRWLFYVFVILSIMVFGKWGPTFDKSSFIYFQF